MFNHFNTSREHSAECYPETKCTHHDGVASAKNLPDSRAGAARPKIENRRRIKRQNSQTPTRALTEFRNAPGDAVSNLTTAHIAWIGRQIIRQNIASRTTMSTTTSTSQKTRHETIAKSSENRRKQYNMSKNVCSRYKQVKQTVR